MPISTTRLGSILLVTLQRPERANALSDELIGAIGDQIDEIERDTETRAVVVTGAGTTAFCAGADVRELVDLDEAAARAKMLHGQRVFRRLELLPLPVIAAVNGHALGGGLELAMACDLRIAARSARFGQPEIRLANVPGWGGTQRLPRLVGLGRATEMIFTGDLLSAEEACRIGLVNRVVADEQVTSEALALAERLAAYSTVALAGAKHAIHVGLDEGMTAGELAEAHAVATCCQTAAQRKAVTDFLNRRAAAHNHPTG
ncbi:enoyl-CoA hydratase/isomerase family protein [Phytohabitans flavus]|uniref:enoyl-CoA hydratase/isomerase family protein n=1 Tax=Phytohabitans flavus TaxID=1076124 RepID=UPI001562F8AA|nr:enoyl-CoA hydratase-related protein [Phytohabitans flavus]